MMQKCLLLFSLAVMVCVFPQVADSEFNESEALAKEVFKGLPEHPIKYGPFSVEPALFSRVRFWVDVYTRHHRWDIVVHDRDYPGVVFDVVAIDHIEDNPLLGNSVKRRRVARLITERKNRIRKILKSLHKNYFAVSRGWYKLDAEEQKIVSQYKQLNIPMDKIVKDLDDSKRVRSQRGMRESFIDGLYESGRYLPLMKNIVTAMGAPEEIAYLPFLESGYNKDALSKVGASGLWQFMRQTGKSFFRVDESVDERNDPMKAAEGAALLMKLNYTALEEWPLAVTAYNHGRAGMLRAVEKVGSHSLAKIINNYNGYMFGFASQNFYTSFVAAVHVAKNYQHYFGKVQQANPIEYEEFVVPEYIDMRILAKKSGIDLKVIRELNPALTDAVYEGELYVPLGYTLRIPMAARDSFLSRYAAIPKKYKFLRQKNTIAHSEETRAMASEDN